MPPKVTDPDGSEEGWFRTDDGVIAVGEPQGTAAWIPCNNVPGDKATFGFQITVPGRARGGRQRPAAAGVNRGNGVQTELGRIGADEHLPGGAQHRPRPIVKSRAGGLPTWT